MSEQRPRTHGGTDPARPAEDAADIQPGVAAPLPGPASGTDTAALPPEDGEPHVAVTSDPQPPQDDRAVAGSAAVQRFDPAGDVPPSGVTGPSSPGSTPVSVAGDAPRPEDPPSTSVSTTHPPNAPAPLHSARPALPSHPEEAVGFLAVLRRTDFRMLWGAQAASQLADKFLMFSLIVVVYNLSHASSTESLLMIAYTLPSVVLSAPAGVWADRHDKRILMLATNVLRAGMVLLIPLSQIIPGIHGQVWPLILVTLMFSAVGQVFAPAEAASIPFLVSREQIMTATSLFMTTVIITLVVGVPLATLSIKLFGDMAPFWIGSGLFALAALGILRIGTSLRAAAKAAAPHTELLRELREGMVILGRHPALRIALAQLTLSLVVVFTVFVLGPAYMRHVLGRQAEDTYLVLIPATVGMVATAVVLGRATRLRITRAQLLLGALLVAGVTLTAFGLVPGIFRRAGVGLLLTPSAVVFAAVFGCALGALLIPAFTVLQERTTEETRGRIFGGIFTVINAAVALPLLLAGGVADAFGVDRAVAGLGVLLVIGALVTRTRRVWASLHVLDEPPGVAEGAGI